jgi:hypothetical protein
MEQIDRDARESRMGITYDLYALSPTRFARLAARMEQGLPESAAQLRSLYEAEEGTLDDLFADDWEDASIRDRTAMFVDVLFQLSQEQSWYLDKSLSDFSLRGIFRHIPELRALPLLTFKETDVSVPLSLSDLGWTGIWSADAVERWPVDVERFADRQQVERYEPPPGGLFWRWRGGAQKSRAAALRWLNEYEWDHWASIVSAVQSTKLHRTHLALRFA